MNALQLRDFSELLARVAGQETMVKSHSASVKPGDTFVVLPPAWSSAVPALSHAGRPAGGEHYLVAAIEAGARYIVCAEHTIMQLAPLLGDVLPSGESFFIVPHPEPRAALGELATAQYGGMARYPELIGITGTNGKTTETYLLEKILVAAGEQVGVLGTVEYRWPGHQEASPLTTPGCLELHALLRSMSDAGAESAIMEISSHALDQQRLAGLSVKAGLFTNLTQDHLDYHNDMESYFAAKCILFSPQTSGTLHSDSMAMAVNTDDPYGLRLFRSYAGKENQLAYGLGAASDLPADCYLQGSILSHSRHGLCLRMNYQGRSWELASPLVGTFNALNLLGAQALALALGYDRKIFECLHDFAGVPGRLERIANPRNMAVFVDYAHTPDALEKTLQALQEADFKRIITVFGCGGNRDAGKRPLMAAAAEKYSSVVVVTSDNPRHEDPLAIIADITGGFSPAADVRQEPDRAQAIRLALSLAQPGDAVLLAGKGHERYQVIADVRRPFSDQQVARELLGCA